MEKARVIGISEEDIQGAVNLAKIISEKGDERMLEYADSLLQAMERANTESNGQTKKKRG